MNRIPQKYWFVVYVLYLLVAKSIAQDYTTYVQTLGLEDGLSSSNISGIIQDSRGFIWIGTAYGLNRYDGTEIKTYTQEESGLCHNRIQTFTEDAAGNLWINASDFGGEWHTCIFNPLEEVFYSIEDYLGTAPPFDITKTTFYSIYNGSILFAERKEGFLAYYEFDGKQIRHLFDVRETITNKLNEGPIYKLNEQEYVLYRWNWAGSNEVAHFVHLDTTGQLLGRDSCNLPVDFMLGSTVGQGEFCAICMDDKLKDKGYWQIAFLTDEFSKQTSILTIKDKWAEKFVYHQDKIYTLTTNALKIYARDGELLQEIPLSLNLTNEYFNWPFIDQSGNIWLDNNGQLNRISLQKKHFETELYDEETPRRIRSIVEDESKQLYIGGVGYLLNEKNNSDYKELPTIKNHLGLLADGDYIWAGTEYSGLLRYDKKTQIIQFFPKEKEVAGKYGTLLWMPHKAEGGSIWVGGSQGLYRISEEQNKVLPVDFYGDFEKLQTSAIYAFYED